MKPFKILLIRRLNVSCTLERWYARWAIMKGMMTKMTAMTSGADGKTGFDTVSTPSADIIIVCINCATQSFILVNDSTNRSFWFDDSTKLRTTCPLLRTTYPLLLSRKSVFFFSFLFSTHYYRLGSKSGNLGFRFYSQNGKSGF